MAVPAGSHSRILLALVLGATAGSAVNYAVRRDYLSASGLEWFVKYVSQPIGDIFVSLLFLPIIPLVFASLAVGVTRLGGSNIGRIGFKTITYFILTTVCAAAIGLTAVNLFRPGVMKEEQSANLKERMKDRKAQDKTKPADFGIQTFVNIVPRNPLKAFVEKEMLAIIFTSILVGVALTRIDPERSRLLIEILEGVNAVTDYIIRLAMWIAPVGVLALIFTTTALFGVELLESLIVFMITVLAGLAVQLLVVFPVLVALLGGMNPIRFFRRSRLAMITAFSTSSSAATLPTAVKVAEEELGVPSHVARFVLPLSVSMNHNGTALFEAVTAVFLCQLFGVTLNFEQQAILLMMCVLTATGMAGVPGGSLPLIGLVVYNVAPSVPPEAILIVLGVDRILDMCRTMVNVTGDLTTALYVARSEPIEPQESATNVDPPGD